MLLSRLHATATNTFVVYSAAARQQRLHDRRQQSKAENARGGGKSRGYIVDEDADLSFRPDSPFPWGAAGVAVVCGAIYLTFSNIIAVGVFVPIVNSIFFIGLAIYAFNKLKAGGVIDRARKKGRGRQRGFLKTGVTGVSRGKRSTRKSVNYLFG